MRKEIGKGGRKGTPRITNSNHAYFDKMTGCGFQAEVTNKSDGVYNAEHLLSYIITIHAVKPLSPILQPIQKTFHFLFKMGSE